MFKTSKTSLAPYHQLAWHDWTYQADIFYCVITEDPSQYRESSGNILLSSMIFNQSTQLRGYLSRLTLSLFSLFILTFHSSFCQGLSKLSLLFFNYIHCRTGRVGKLGSLEVEERKVVSVWRLCGPLHWGRRRSGMWGYQWTTLWTLGRLETMLSLLLLPWENQAVHWQLCRRSWFDNFVCSKL